MKQCYKKKIAFLLVVIVMISIFILSSQPATHSKALSNQFIGTYKKLIENLPFISESIRRSLLIRASHYVRKLAHLTIYMLLGGFTFSALRSTALKKRYILLLSVCFCMVYAFTDEWHQYYVAGRGAQLTDILLDTVGSIIGIAISQLIVSIYHRMRFL